MDDEVLLAAMPPAPTALVLEGGGTKGLAYCGAIAELETRGILRHIRAFAGASAGAITALALAVGYTAAELEALMRKTPFASFVDDKPGVVRDAWMLMHKFGWCAGDKLQAFIEGLVAAKAAGRQLTFGQLHAERGVTLVINATDVRRGATVYFHHAATPDVPIALAARASASVPFLFVPVRIGDAVLVDGGLMDNYPLHVFDGRGLCDPRARRNLCPPSPRTLGLKLVTTSEDASGDALLATPQDVSSFMAFSRAVMQCPLLETERATITSAYWARTIPIHVPDIPVTRFSLSADETAQLVEAGRQAARTWAATHTFSA